MRNVALQLHKDEYSWEVKIRNTSEAVSGHKTPLGHHTDCGPMGLGKYNSLGEYYGPHTASSVFLILIPVASTCMRYQMRFHETLIFGENHVKIG